MSQALPVCPFIECLNHANAATAAAMLDPVVERLPWLVNRVVSARPFRNPAELASYITAILISLSPAERLRVLRAHPELAPPAPEAMTAASQREQSRVDLARPSRDVAERLTELNHRYVQKYGFPFILALHAQEDIDAILAQFVARLEGDTEFEQARALAEVVSVMRARLARLTHAPSVSMPGPISPPNQIPVSSK